MGRSSRTEEEGGSLLRVRAALSAQAQLTEEFEDHSLSLPKDMHSWSESHRVPGQCQGNSAGVKKLLYREMPGHYHQTPGEKKKLLPEERVKVRLFPKSKAKAFWELAREDF